MLDFDDKCLDEIIKRLEYVKLAGFSNQTGAQLIHYDVPILLKAINKAQADLEAQSVDMTLLEADRDRLEAQIGAVKALCNPSQTRKLGNLQAVYADDILAILDEKGIG